MRRHLETTVTRAVVCKVEDDAPARITVHPGDLGENTLTRGVALLALPVGAGLHLGDEAIVEATGLRNPCGEIDAFQPGLLTQVVGKSTDGKLSRKAGIIGIVLARGRIAIGDRMTIELPEPPFLALERL